ncbi:DUF3071 domain-containing protein, partial [Mycobacterium sp. ITM-2017-0098]
IDPNFARTLRPLAPVAQLAIEEIEAVVAPEPEPEPVVETPEPEPVAAAPRPRKGRPAVPAWEDVLLGVRSSGGGQR